MPDKYQALRESAAAATTGPWERHDTGGFVRCVRQAVSGRGICSTFVQNPPKTPAGWENQRHQNNANSGYIAVANPATIQALLAERDALREALMLTLPLAKGYAAANPVGSNAQYIEQAETALSL